MHVAFTIALNQAKNCLALPKLQRVEHMYAASSCALHLLCTCQVQRNSLLQGARQLVDVDARCNRLLLPDEVVACKGLQPCLARMDLRANAVAAHPQYRCCAAMLLGSMSLCG